MTSPRVIVVGAGVGGLVAALRLAQRGFAVTVIDQAAAPGGKMRSARVGGRDIDCGPTVLTMRWVFDEIFAEAGTSLEAHLRLTRADILARHAWGPDERLDLFADLDRSTHAIGTFAGRQEAEGFRRFSDRARAVYGTLERSFIRAAEPSPLSLVSAGGWRGLGALWQIKPFATLWSELGTFFADPRLRQLFGRYATYCGASPFAAPATLMLIAHVERAGVWLIDGGMHALARALADRAVAAGATLRYATKAAAITSASGRVTGVMLSTGERLEADAVLFAGDTAALAAGDLGADARTAVASRSSAVRSLSAITWAMMAETSDFPLSHHSVFFSADYAAEFSAIFGAGRLPEAPTVYVCAQDRDAADGAAPEGAERIFCLVNAPARGDSDRPNAEEIARCEAATFAHLRHCGLSLRPAEPPIVTNPATFARMFPATGGALYGPASHGWRSAFARPTARSRVPGMYLAGGSVHPGPGVPMAALSGRMAAAAILEDLASTRRSHRVAMPGGMSTR